MNPSPALLAASLATVSWTITAAEADLSKLPPPSDKAGLTYAKDIHPLFEASCFNCHGERRQRAGLRLDSLEAVLQGSDEGKVVVTGKSKESTLVHAVAQIDDETAMPPKRQRGGFGGGGPGGPGGRSTNGPGRGGFGGGFAGMFSGQWFEQADKNKDHKLTQAEFTELGATWFAKIDSKKTGKLTQQEFSGGLDDVLPLDLGGGGGGGGGRGPGGQRGGNEGMGFGVGRFLGGALFTSADADKDNSLTSAELSGLFSKWFAGWDTNKTGSLSEGQFRDGLAASMARNNPGGGRGPGGFGGPGGPGGFGGGGFGMFGRQALAQQMVTQADKDKDAKLSKAEFTALADVWFDKLDADKAGRVTQEKFTERFAEALALPPTPAGGQPPRPAPGDGERPGRPGGQREGGDAQGGRGRGPGGGGPGGFGGPANLAPGLFGAADGNKDGSLSREELKATFEKWFTEFDSAKSGSLNEETLYAGLRERLPQGGMGGFGGFGGGDQGPAPKPLTAEQVGLVRAWIDQGAK